MTHPADGYQLRRPAASRDIWTFLSSLGESGFSEACWGIAVQKDLNEIAQKHGIVLALKFGSSVTGQVHPKSDADLAILLDRSNITLREHAELLQSLQPLFPDRELDLALINHADPRFLKKITDNCELL